MRAANVNAETKTTQLTTIAFLYVTQNFTIDVDDRITFLASCCLDWRNLLFLWARLMLEFHYQYQITITQLHIAHFMLARKKTANWIKCERQASMTSTAWYNRFQITDLNRFYIECRTLLARDRKKIFLYRNCAVCFSHFQSRLFDTHNDFIFLSGISCRVAIRLSHTFQHSHNSIWSLRELGTHERIHKKFWRKKKKVQALYRNMCIGILCLRKICSSYQI